MNWIKKIKAYREEQRQIKLEKEKLAHQKLVADLQKMLDDKRKELQEQGKL